MCGRSMESSLCCPIVSVPIGQHHCSTANSEQAIGDKHGALIPKVPVLRDVLCTHHQAVLIRVHLQSITHVEHSFCE